MSDLEVILTLLGLTAVTVFTRSFFFLSRRELRLSDWAKRGLRYAPLAALAAVITPEVLLSQGVLIQTWKNPLLFGTLAGGAYFFWRRGLLGTIVVGMIVFLGLSRWWR